MTSGPSARPLDGLRVVVTRATHQAGPLIEALTQAGARVASMPLLDVVPPRDPRAFEQALTGIDHYDWLVFASSNAVRATLPRLPAIVDAGTTRPLIAVVGPATAHAVRDLGCRVDLEAQRHDGEGLAQALADSARKRGRVLVPRAADGRLELIAGLERQGFHVDAVTAYDKRLPTEAGAQAAALFENAPLGWVIFTSPRTVTHFVRVLEGLGQAPAWPARRGELRALALGATTAAALRDEGVMSVVAETPTTKGLVAALVRDVQAQS